MRYCITGYHYPLDCAFVRIFKFREWLSFFKIKFGPINRSIKGQPIKVHVSLKKNLH